MGALPTATIASSPASVAASAAPRAPWPTAPVPTTSWTGRYTSHLHIAAVSHGHRPRPAPHLLGKVVKRLAHLRVPQMHLSIKVIRQPTVVVQAGEICAADVADLQLLVARRAGGVAEGLELLLALELLLLGLPHAEELVVGAADLAQLAQDLHLEQAVVDGRGEVGDGLEEHVGLADLVGRLLQPPLGDVDAPVALVDVLLQVPHVVVLEAVALPLGLGEPLVLGLEGFGVYFRAGAEVLLCVGEEVVWASASDIGAACFGVGQRDLGRPRCHATAHELLCDSVSLARSYQ